METDPCQTLQTRYRPPAGPLARIVLDEPGKYRYISPPDAVELAELFVLATPVVTCRRESVSPDRFCQSGSSWQTCNQSAVLGVEARRAVNLKRLRLLDPLDDTHVLEDREITGQTAPAGVVHPLKLFGTAAEPGVLDNIFLTPGRYILELEGESVDCLDRDGRFLTHHARGTLILARHSSRSLQVGKTYVKNVDLTEGYLHDSHTDLHLADKGLDLDFTRSWSGGGARPDFGPLGEGWQHSARVCLVQDQCGDLLVSGGDGSGLRFRRTGSAWVPERGHHATLTEAGGVFTLTTKTGIRYLFGDPEETGTGSLSATGALFLRRIEEPAGESLTYEYLGPGYPAGLASRVVHSSGSMLELTYESSATGWRISRALLADSNHQPGELVRYTYDDCGRLRQAAAEGVPGREGAGWQLRYGYGEESLTRYRLEEIRGPGPGNLFTVTYLPPDTDPFHPEEPETCRVASVREGEADSAVTVDFTYQFQSGPVRLSQSTTVTAGGRPETYTFGETGLLLAHTNADGGVRRLAWCTENNGICETLPASELQPDGRKVEYTWDARGNPATVTETPAGGGEPSVRVLEYDLKFGKPVYERTPGGLERFWRLDPTTGLVLALTGQADGETHEFTYSYDEWGNLTSATEINVDPRNKDSEEPRTTTFSGYDLHGRAGGETDPAGRSTTRQWNAWGELEEMRGFTGEEQTFTYDAFHRPASRSATNGLADGRKRVLTESFTYFPGGQLASRRQEDTGSSGPGFIEESFTLDGLNRVTGKSTRWSNPLPGGGTTGVSESFTYDAHGNVTEHTDAAGRAHTFEYSLLDKETLHTVTEGGATLTASSKEYEPGTGRLLAERDAAGRLTRYLYDGFGRPAAVIKNPAGPLDTPTPRPAAGEFPGLEDTAELSGRVFTAAAYDLEGRPVKQMDGAGAVTVFTWDGFGRKIAETNALHQTVTFRYDRAGNLLSSADAVRGLTISFMYDRVNRITAKTVQGAAPPAGAAWPAFTYGWAMKYTDGPGGLTTEVTNLETGAITRTLADGAGRVWETVTDAERLDSTTTGSGGAGRVRETVTDAERLALTATASYDAFGHLRETTDPAGNTTRHAVNPAGWQLLIEDPEGYRTRRAYFPDGLLREETAEILPGALELSSPASHQVRQYRHAYDSLGRPATVQRLAESGLITENSFAYSAFTETGDPLARTVTTDVLGRATTRWQDAAGRVPAVQLPANGSQNTSLFTGSDGAGRPVAAVNLLGWTDYSSYDRLGRITRFEEARERLSPALPGISSAPAPSAPPSPAAPAAQSSLRPVKVEWLDALNQRIEEDPAGHRTLVQTDPLGREVSTLRLTVEGSLREEGLTFPEVLDRLVLSRRFYDSENRVVLEADAAGAAVQYEYDGAGRLVRKTAGLSLAPGATVPQSTPATALWRYRYDANGNLTEEYSPRLAPAQPFLRHRYNPRNGLMATTDAAGNTTRFEYDGAGRRTALVSPAGLRTEYTYDSSGNVSSVTLDAGGELSATWRFLRDAAGRLLVQQDPRGGAVQRIYDNHDRVTALRQLLAALPGPLPADAPPGTPVWQYTFDALGNLLTAEDPDGRARELAYGRFNQLLREAWSSPGAPAANLPDVPLETGYTYDDNRNLTRVEERKLVRPELAAQSRGQILAAGSPFSTVHYTTEYTYDGLDRLAGQTDGYWRQNTKFFYGRDGARTGVVFPGESEDPSTGEPPLRYTYDAAQRLTAVLRANPGNAPSPSSAITAAPPPAPPAPSAGPLSAWHGRPGRVPEQLPALAGDTEEPSAGPWPGRMDGTASAAWHGRPGRVTDEAPVGPSSRPADPAADQQFPETAAPVSSSPSPLRSLGSLWPNSSAPGSPRPAPSTSRGPALEEEEAFSTPPPPSPGRQLLAATTAATYTYYPDGLPATATFANGTVTTYAYFANGWLQAVETRQHTGGLVSRYEYEYDGDGNRTVMREWNATPAKRAADPLWAAAPEITTYDYDRLSRLTGVTYPDGRHCVYTYDQTGNRLTEKETNSNGQTVKDREYSYNLLNQVVFIRDLLQPGNSIRYEYNLSGDTTAKITGTLDSSGQIVPGTEKYRLTFTWDVTGKLRQVLKLTPGTGGPVTQLIAEFSYDYAGRRIRKDGNFIYPDPATPVPSETRCYIYDETAVLVEYTPSPSTGLAKTRQYLYGNDLLACERFTEAGPLSSFYHQDALGSTVNLSKADGSVEESYLYDAWGNYRALDETGANGGSPTFNPLAGYDPATGQFNWDLYLASLQAAFAEDPAGSGLPGDGNWNRFTYTGHEFDPETGLYYFKARFYDPDLGRFLSEDPYLGDSLTPPSLHRYLYAYANPLTYVDLFGYATIKATTLKQLSDETSDPAGNRRNSNNETKFGHTYASTSNYKEWFKAYGENWTQLHAKMSEYYRAKLKYVCMIVLESRSEVETEEGRELLYKQFINTIGKFAGTITDLKLQFMARLRACKGTRIDMSDIFDSAKRVNDHLSEATIQTMMQDKNFLTRLIAEPSARLGLSLAGYSTPREGFDAGVELTLEAASWISMGLGVVKAGRLTLALLQEAKAAADGGNLLQGIGKVISQRIESYIAKNSPKIQAPNRGPGIPAKPSEIPELVIDYNKYPELADNIRNAQKAGHPDVLTHGGDITGNRAAALQDVPNIKPLSRDEYPFASSMEGGEGSWVGHIPKAQQNSQGALIKNFLEKYGIKPGDQYRVRIINAPNN